MKKSLLLVIFAFCTVYAKSQAINILSTNTTAEQVMLGNYNPATYMASTIICHPDSISQGINARIDADSLKATILKMATFHNRNSGTDTNMTTKGFGAARRWVYAKFKQYSLANENRLIPSYLQFDQTICGIGQHRNVFAVLPGMDTSDKRVIFVEGHMDSRCEVLCDTACVAQGIEDNASGTALVLELCRVMSKYSYNHTIVFIVTTAEEQGLDGAEAFADYVQAKGIKVKCVQNNDVVGGILCGVTSSPPSCPGLGNVDSTGVRLFSAGSFNSPHKQHCRFIKLEYKEELLPYVSVPMDIRIQSPEDRTGRGGDHIPFRQHGYTAMRMTSANEHGDASVGPGYTDRQHSERDTLGVDTNGDMIIDSFFVDFNYLARNAVINGNAMGMAGIGPKTPTFNVTVAGEDSIYVDLTSEEGYDLYRVAVRSTTHDWDTVFYMNDTAGIFIVNPAVVHYISVAAVDTNGVESLFSGEKLVNVPSNVHNEQSKKGMKLLPNTPNPFDEATTISVLVEKEKKYKTAFIVVTDLSGKEISKMSIELKKGMNEVLYTHGYHAQGTFIYSLVIDGKVEQSGKMLFAN
ncbi:MAG TPA: M28 family peptidase [Flavobacteriales bacterium]|nr:M28 family peptidase [Flavobacteriales bacterium]